MNLLLPYFVLARIDSNKIVLGKKNKSIVLSVQWIETTKLFLHPQILREIHEHFTDSIFVNDRTMQYGRINRVRRTSIFIECQWIIDSWNVWSNECHFWKTSLHKKTTRTEAANICNDQQYARCIRTRRSMSFVQRHSFTWWNEKKSDSFGIDDENYSSKICFLMRKYHRIWLSSISSFFFNLGKKMLSFKCCLHQLQCSIDKVCTWPTVKGNVVCIHIKI